MNNSSDSFAGIVVPERSSGDTERGDSSDEQTWSRLRSRRPHVKSRLGCVCDEARPACKRCVRYGAACTYTTTEPAAQGRSRASLMQNQSPSSSPGAEMFSMSLASTAESITTLLHPSTALAALRERNPSVIAKVNEQYLKAVHHFSLFTTHTLGSPVARHIIRTKVLPISFTSSHLMHGLIAVSIAHLRNLNPSHNSGVYSELYHWQRALSGFQHELQSPITRENADSMVSTCMVLTILAYISDETSIDGSWVFGPAQTTNWLYTRAGLDGVLPSYDEDGRRSNIWAPVLEDGDDFRGTFSDERPGIEDIPPAFVELCDLTPTSDVTNNPYQLPLRTLSALLKLEHSSATFGKLVVFVGRVDGEYCDLLQRHDPRALLILSYWFAMMCAVDQWWVHARVHSECARICRFLERNEDPRIVELLEVPAKACGYALFSQSQEEKLEL
ncbi:hypothetical protein AJ80_04701 [Polytolypa hystricis UAMH7299]|uniref:Zn(2)-C6 fungal-type domain-containing protein n=1 Tax=Polytolypa hystricis (strain UAMH7299) TaxID=1447883 RepID=A0A2B7Y9H9_POLH7|nr:hypothetical protein AJ80_04701 [Polytolypa hystricis UAMH7299]